MAVTLNANSSTGFIATSDTSGVLQLQTNGTAALTIGTDQSVNFPATGQRITGDFSNATVANRVAFQTSTTNGNSTLYLAPNGTATSSAFVAFNNSSITNSSVSYLGVSSTVSYIEAGKTGTGTYLPLTFNTNGSEQMRIDSSGNVGIGVSPSYKLHVYGSTPDMVTQHSGANGTRGAITSDNGAVYFSSTYSSSSVPTIFTQAGIGASGTERMRIDSSGNVGVGTTSPATFSAYTKLSVLNGVAIGVDASNAGRIVGSTTTGTELSYLTMGGNYNLGSTGEIALATSTAKSIIFGTNATERARIDSSGNLLVGATASANSTYSIATFRGASKGIAIQDSGSAAYRAIYMGGGNNLYFYNGTNEGYLSSAGAWTNASDARLKTNVRNIEYGLATVLETQPRHYERVDVEGTYIGFVAQELQEVIPEVVSGDPEKQLGVDYGSLVAVAFKAIQEQQALINQLQADVAALKGASA
jgi:hypothetical protein